MGRTDRIVFLVLASATWAYVITRAIMVPAVHDEPMAFHKYVLTGDFVPFVAEAGAGNHVLYSALAQVSYFLFGPDLFALRSWSVLAFVLYAWYVWRCGAWLGPPLIRWCAWCALLCVPFMLEFFSLARGYGLAMGFCMMALFHHVRFAEKARTQDLVIGLVGNGLGMWSLLSMLMVGCAMLLIPLVVIFRDRSATGRQERLRWWFLLGPVPWCCAVVYARRLQEHGAFYAGSDQGYLRGTIVSLLQSVLGTDGPSGAMLFALVVVVAVIGVVFWFKKAGHNGPHIPLVVLLTILLFDMTAQTMTGLLLNTRTPMDRGALYLLPLLLLLFATGLDRLAARRSWLRYAALCLLILPLRVLKDANVDHTTTWPEQAVPERFFDLVAQRQRNFERPLIIGAHRFLANATWSFGARSHGSWSNELDEADFPQPLCDLLMIDTATYGTPGGFRTIAEAPSGRNTLMERVVPLRVVLRVDSALSFPMSRDEFRLLWQVKAAQWQGSSLLLEFGADIISERGTTDAQMLTGVNGISGEGIFRGEVNIDHQRGSSLKGHYRVGMRLPTIDDRADHIVFCVYDPLRRRFALDAARLRVWEILP